MSRFANAKSYMKRQIVHYIIKYGFVFVCKYNACREE